MTFKREKRAAVLYVQLILFNERKFLRYFLRKLKSETTTGQTDGSHWWD